MKNNNTNKGKGIVLTFVAFALIASLNTCSDMHYHKENENPANDLKKIAQEFQEQNVIVPTDSKEAEIDKYIDELANQKAEETEIIKQK